MYFNDLRLAFIRKLPASTLNEEQIDEQINEMNGFYFKRLTAKTSILKLQNFSYVFVETIEKLIEKNQDLLENSENLIIDLRDNGGGTGNAYQKLLPYILTNPLRRIGVEHLSTQTTITAYEQWLQTLKTDSIKNKDDIEKTQKYFAKLKSNLGKFVNLDGDSVIIDTIKLAPKSPRQIAILTNGNVGSAAENLTLYGKQSKKVKILGTPTEGVLDYADARFFEFGCGNYQLLLPTYRSLRLPDFPIDNIGIQPDIYLDKSVVDWVKYAIKYLEQ
ncbi:MAG: S41 family peptidase [Bacteroidota bacterium]